MQRRSIFGSSNCASKLWKICRWLACSGAAVLLDYFWQEQKRDLVLRLSKKEAGGWPCWMWCHYW